MKKIQIVTLLMCIASALPAQIDWGKNDAEGIYKNGQYYAVYDDAEKTIKRNETVTYTYTVPGNLLAYEAKRQTVAIGNINISAGNDNWSFACSTSYEQDSRQVNRSSRSLVFSNPSPNTLSRYIRNVHLTMASYLNVTQPASWKPDTEIESTEEQWQFSFDWCNTGKIVVSYEGDPAFRVDEGEYVTDGKYGTATVMVVYTPTEVGNHTGTLKITNQTTTYVVILDGTGHKHVPTLSWKDNLTPMQVGAVHTDAATVSNGGLVSYTSSDPSVLRVEDNSLIAVAPGTAVVTASYDGNDKWERVSENKEITVTMRQAQYILWTQSFMRLNTEMADLLLQAQSYATETDTPTGLPVIYTSSDPSVVEVRSQTDANGTICYYLHIVHEGRATLTASCVGNVLFAPADEVSVDIVVRVPSDGCNPLVYEQVESTRLFTSDDGPEIELAGEPGYITFDAQNSKWGLISAAGDMVLYQRVEGEWRKVWTDPLEENKWNSYGPFLLDRNATHIQFRMEGGRCYHTYTNVAVTLAKYLEPEQSSLTFEAAVGATVEYTLPVSYSNIQDVLYVELVGTGATEFHVTPAMVGNECGDKGVQELVVSFAPMTKGMHEAVLRIADSRGKMVAEVSLMGNASYSATEWVAVMPGDNGGDYTYDGSNMHYNRLIYVMEGDNYANLHIPSGSMTFERETNVLLTIEADRWRTLVPPFDVDATYIIELVPEAELSVLSRTEAVAVQQVANRELYRWLAERTAVAITNDTETLISLIEQYLDRLRAEKGYSVNDVGVWRLEQYNGKNSWTANYYAYAAGNGIWDLSEDTHSGFLKEWDVEPSTHCLLRKGQVYALRFPYCVECEPVSCDLYDYWSGKCLLLHGEGKQFIEGADAQNALLAMQPAYGQALLAGNYTLAALPLVDGQVYVHQTDPAHPYYDCYVRQEAGMDLPPLSSILFADMADNAGRTLRAVSRFGKVWYDIVDVTTGLPTLANNAAVVVSVLPDGLWLQTKEETPAALYTVSGMLVWQGNLNSVGQSISLSQSGVYVLCTSCRTDKIFIP